MSLESCDLVDTVHWAFGVDEDDEWLEVSVKFIAVTSPFDGRSDALDGGSPSVEGSGLFEGSGDFGGGGPSCLCE